MNLIIQHRHHQPSASFGDLVEHELNALNACRRIDEARVFIERQPGGTPPFRISVHLITSGPDLTEEATDHTLRAAFGKLIIRVRKKLEPLASRSHRNRRKIPSIAAG